MREEQIGGVTCRFTGGVDGSGGGEGPMAVLLHGFGAPGDDLVPLWQLLGRGRGDIRFVFPAAPLELPMFFGDSRAWWMIDTARLEREIASGAERDRSRETPDGLAEARGLIESVLDALVRDHGADRARTVLGGFSQGAMLSTDVVLRAPSDYAGLVILSGTFLCADQWEPLIAARHRVPVFQSHGRADELLPFSAAEALRARFEQSEVDHSWHPFQGGHEIPQAVAAGCREFLHRVLPVA